MHSGRPVCDGRVPVPEGCHLCVLVLSQRPALAGGGMSRPPVATIAG
nr:MAG TPA: hypothetical protein [Caudoviricetes sp.]